MRRERKWPKILRFNKVLVVIRTWPNIAVRKVTGDVTRSVRIVIPLFYYIITIITFYLTTRVAEKSEKSELLIYLGLVKTRLSTELSSYRGRIERAYRAVPPLYK